MGIGSPEGHGRWLTWRVRALRSADEIDEYLRTSLNTGSTVLFFTLVLRLVDLDESGSR